MDGDGRAHRVPLDQLLDTTQAGEHREHDECGAYALEVVAAAEADTDGGDDPDRGGTRQAHEGPARVENRAGPDEADARDDLPGHPGGVRAPPDSADPCSHHGEREVSGNKLADEDENVSS